MEKIEKILQTTTLKKGRLNFSRCANSLNNFLYAYEAVSSIAIVKFH